MKSDMNPWLAMVKEFNDSFGLDVKNYYSSNNDRDTLLLNLIKEELEELEWAHNASDLEETMDALGDTLVTVIGYAYRMKIDIEEVMRRVHKSNMSKLGADGKPIYREDGKLMKGPNFEPPNFEDLDDKLLLEFKNTSDPAEF